MTPPLTSSAVAVAVIPAANPATGQRGLFSTPLPQLSIHPTLKIKHPTMKNPITMDSFAAAYILNHKNDAWYNLRGGRRAYGQGDLEVILWTGVHAYPKRLRWEATLKGEPITLKHPKRIWQALARNAQANYFPSFPDKYKEITEKIRIQDLKKILKIKD